MARNIPWRRKQQPAPIFLLQNSMDRRGWWATVNGVAKRWTQLSMPFCPKACDTCLKILRTLNCVLCNRFTSFYFAAAALHLAVRIPVDGGIINNNIFFAFQGIYGTMINFIFPRMVSKELFLYLIALNTNKKK